MTNSHPLAALIAGVKVKPLEWDAPVRYGAKLEHMTTCRTYKVVEWEDASGHVLWFGQAGEPIRIDADGAAVGADVLKAAAQADYEARILAALEAATPPDLVEVDFDAIAYGFWSIHPRDIPEPIGMPDKYKGGPRAWHYAQTMRQTFSALIALATAQAAQIEGLEAKARESAMQELASLGQAQEAYEAQLAAEAAAATLRAEVERLRGALEKINVGEGWAAKIARAALEGKA